MTSSPVVVGGLQLSPEAAAIVLFVLVPLWLVAAWLAVRHNRKGNLR